MKSVWSGLLGERAYRADEPWEHAGGDKLKMLRLAHGIERRLGRPIPLAAMTSSTRPSDFIATLIELQGAYARPGPVNRTVFVLPGARGDDPNLVAFRACLGTDHHCVAVSYPRWESLVTPGASLSTIVDAVVGQIERQAGSEPITLLAYSVGGLVAHEVARRLTLAGKQLAFVGIIDSFVSSKVRIDLPFDRPPGKRKPDPLHMRIGYRIAAILHPRTSLKRLIARLVGRIRLPRDIAFFVRHYMTLWTMTIIVRAWVPGLLAQPVTLFRARIHSEHIPYDLGWGPFTPNLSIVDVDGNHFSIIGGTHLHGLVAKVREVLAADDPDMAVRGRVNRYA